jgi:small subunit ribosomal protein S6
MAAITSATSQRHREYETIYVLRPAVTKESSEGISARLADVVAREGGTLTRIENWGIRRLAYPVAKQKRGVYVFLKYIGKGGLVSEVERNLRLLDDVLKYQTVKTNDEVAHEGLVVAPEDVKFEHVEIPEGLEQDESRARELGLEDRHDRDDHPPRRDPYADEAEGFGDDEGGDAASEDDE